MREIPEIAAVDVANGDDLKDWVIDDETGAVLDDRRAPDLTGDRAALEYQGIDPDSRLCAGHWRLPRGWQLVQLK